MGRDKVQNGENGVSGDRPSDNHRVAILEVELRLTVIAVSW